MANAVAPIQKKRAEILQEMTAAGRKVAEEFEKKLGIGAQGIVMVQYDLGARLADVFENEADYGTGYCKQLAAYLSIPGGETTLYSLRNFSQAFERGFVKDETTQPLANGQYLELGHWVKLSQLKDRSDVKAYLKRIRTESMSARELSREISATGAKLRNSRQGGRKPSAPSSPLAGLQQTFSLAQKFANLEDVLETNVFKAIDHMPAESVNETLQVKLGETKEKLTEMVATGQRALKHIDKNIERVERVLKDRPPEEKAEKPAKGKGKKAAKKGAKSKRAKKPVRKKRQIATVE